MMADSLVWLSGATETTVSLPFINEATRTEFSYYLSQVSQIIDTGPTRPTNPFGITGFSLARGPKLQPPAAQNSMANIGEA